MENSVFITGSSLCCFLGNHPQHIIENIKKLDVPDYEAHIKLFDDGYSYQLRGFSQSPTQKLYEVVEHVVKDAVKAAKLTPQMQEELGIFIGSTSMTISANEEKTHALGHAAIGDFVESILASKQGYYIFSTGCTSSANALSYASRMIKQKKIKRAIVIGVELANKSTRDGFESFMLLSESGVYRPFDQDSDGIMLGEGCSAVILDSQRLTESDFEYLGAANLCDNHSETASDLDGESIFLCMEQAIADAKLTVSDIDIIKSHATGSPNHNQAESAGLEKLLPSPADNHIAICALKSFIGHTLGASGISEIVLLMLCINAGFIPRVAGFKANHQLGFTPLKNTLPIAQKVNILFNYIGFSGNNTALVLSNR